MKDLKARYGWQQMCIRFYPTYANFFVNKKSAKSEDMKSLINYVKKQVKDQTGIKLELEIEVVE